ncbi:MAG: contact-dependent growth inhibition system immunity protein [Flavobacterium sp.]
MLNIDTSKTLEQLENSVWGEPFYNSYLVTTCYALRKKPLKDFTIEDLRIKIGQNDSLQYLMPLAINELKNDILAEGHFFPGDLLKNVLCAETKFWIENESLYTIVKEIVKSQFEVLESDKEHKELIEHFRVFETLVNF